MLNKTKKVEEMSNSAEEKVKSVLKDRKLFENNVNLCQQWFSEVEVIMSADIRLSSLNVVEDQLQKVNYALIFQFRGLKWSQWVNENYNIFHNIMLKFLN